MESLYIRILKKCLTYPQGFGYFDILDDKELSLEDWERNIIDINFFYACQRAHHKDNTIGETMFLFVHGDRDKSNSPENKYILTFDAEFAFMDYQELVFARQNAKEAKSMSSKALTMSMLAVVVSVIVPLWIANKFIQTIRIEDRQLEIIMESFNDIKNNP